MAEQQFTDRADAGRQLAQQLRDYKGREDLVVLALPRGGVPVAEVVASELNAPLDVLIVRKVGLPVNPELAMGAVGSGDVEVVNESVVQSWGVGRDQFKRVALREMQEMERREQAYRGDRPPLAVKDRTVLLVDDGIATGATIKAAVQVLRKLEAKAVVIAVPVAAEETLRSLEKEADAVVCVESPREFRAVGFSYEDFSQTTDEEVCQLLKNAAQRGGQVGSTLH